ncbi:MAG TPA: flagellar biosynthesis regulator FlaF [Xanthobacteraceae bacterium]|nr:flagellar biosynthesis regulator FlaF [Xanthobacteraceae bacterium]
MAKVTASPRELEASLLLRAAARLQTAHDSEEAKQAEMDSALLFNRKLWSIFVTSVTRSDNPLPEPIRQNVANIGLFVLKQSVSIRNDEPERLRSLISINREIAAGLLGRA